MLGVFLVSCAVSLGLIWAVHSNISGRHGIAGVCWLNGVAAAFACLCFSPALGLQAVITLGAAVVCRLVGTRPATTTRCAVGAMVVAYGIVLVATIPRLQQLSQLRKKFPLESMSARLAYETKAKKAHERDPSSSSSIKLSAAVADQMAYLDREVSFHGRDDDLRELHNRSTDAFIMAQGFGPTRMAGRWVRDIELPDPPPIPVTAEPDHDYESASASPPSAGEGEPSLPIPPLPHKLRALHVTGVQDLFNPERLGYIQDRDHVAGFRSHHFTQMPELTPSTGEVRSSWRIVRLELVSLLKHDIPVAYVSKNLPRMDELQKAPTRSLEEFERQALDRLRTDEDVAIDETPERIRLVGSLRARKGCLDCHSAQRGELLGALTYELVPSRPAGRNAAPTSRVPAEMN